MKNDKNLLSIESLRSMLDEYVNEYKIDFGDRYIVRLINDRSNVITVNWIGKTEHDAINAAKEKEEAEKHWAATSLRIEQSGLSTKLKTLLKSAGINTIYELAQNFPEELISTIRGFGWKSINPVQDELARHGWLWGGGRIEDNVPKSKGKKVK
jgi:DNA-directed RNA polymerase alpha subunit